MHISTLTCRGDFDIWQMQLEVALKTQGLWRYITGEETIPVHVPINGPALGAAHTARRNEWLDQLALFDMKDGQAKFTVTSTVTLAILQGVRSKFRNATAKECYDHLCSLYESKMESG